MERKQGEEKVQKKLKKVIKIRKFISDASFLSIVAFLDLKMPNPFCLSCKLTKLIVLVYLAV